MKCPHCNYDSVENEKIHKNEPYDPYKQIGNFFRLPIDMERYHEFEIQKTNLYACPSCMKVFVYRW